MAGERLEVFATGDDPELRARIRAGAPEVEPVMKRDRRVVRVLDEEKGVLGMRGDDLSGRHLRNIETEEETRSIYLESLSGLDRLVTAARVFVSLMRGKISKLIRRIPQFTE